jgi:selenophosphate synthase
MAITLGKDSLNTPPFGTGIISATFTQECETIDISNRENAVGSSPGLPGYKASKAGFVTKTWEIECHDATGLVTALTTDVTGWTVMGVTENISIDGAVTYTVTAKEF